MGTHGTRNPGDADSRPSYCRPSYWGQRLRMHCLDAVQPNHSDDYWNWDFWGTGEAGGTVDGGSD